MDNEASCFAVSAAKQKIVSSSTRYGFDAYFREGMSFANLVPQFLSEPRFLF
jgi:hypothetical protein